MVSDRRRIHQTYFRSRLIGEAWRIQWKAIHDFTVRFARSLASCFDPCTTPIDESASRSMSLCAVRSRFWPYSIRSLTYLHPIATTKIYIVLASNWPGISCFSGLGSSRKRGTETLGFGPRRARVISTNSRHPFSGLIRLTNPIEKSLTPQYCQSLYKFNIYRWHYISIAVLMASKY